MSKFTGSDPAQIHHLDRDPEFLIELPKSVQILNRRTSLMDRGRLILRRAGFTGRWSRDGDCRATDRTHRGINR